MGAGKTVVLTLCHNPINWTKNKMKQRPGAWRRLSSCRACSQQVAYVVSWLKEAQMKPRWASAASAASWDSIRAAKPCPLSPNEVGGLLARVNPSPKPASPPPLPPDSKRHARTREECPGLPLSDDTHRTPSEPSVGLLDGRCEKNSHSEDRFFLPEDSVVITLLTFSVRTAKQKQLMGGASRRGTSRLAVPGEATHLFLLSYWSTGTKPVIELATQTLTSS